MKDVLVDSNVILDIVTEDVNWFEWSEEQTF
jgi:rRNA-processing protein FCF1